METQYFEWDDVKAEANLRKHGVRFEHAVEACEDPFALIELEDSEDYGEDRFILMGGRPMVCSPSCTPNATTVFASYRLARPTTMSGETIIARRRTSDGRLVRVFPDGHEEPLPDPGPLPHLREEEINAAALTDPDNPPRTPEREKHLKRVPQVKMMRRALHLTQEEFAARFHIPLGTLRDWEQGKTQPDQAARAYLRVIARNPKAVIEALESAP